MPSLILEPKEINPCVELLIVCDIILIKLGLFNITPEKSASKISSIIFLESLFSLSKLSIISFNKAFVSYKLYSVI